MEQFELEVIRDEDSVTVQTLDKEQGYPMYMLEVTTIPDTFGDANVSWAGWLATSVSTDFKWKDLNDFREALSEDNVPDYMIERMIQELA